jgi:threonine/homoserine/homoserine lactone efflux protein
MEFLITSFVVVLMPGTGVIYTVSTGITQGRRASMYVALGCTAGIVPHLLATVLGLAAAQFVQPSSDHPLAQLLLLSGIFMGMTFVVFVVYGLIAHAFRSLVIESAAVQRWLRYSFSAAFAGLGTKLAFGEK